MATRDGPGGTMLVVGTRTRRSLGVAGIRDEETRAGKRRSGVVMGSSLGATDPTAALGR